MTASPEGKTAAVGADPVHICLIAGEHSGDHMGAQMMKALRRRLGDKVRFSGIGGAEMTAEGADRGFESFFPMAELAIGGIFEILPHVPRVLRRVRETAERVRALRPEVLLTIDSPAFAFRVGRKLKGSWIPHVHYVAPTVWAWRPRRARIIAGFLDHLLTIFPFEEPYFSKWGLASTFVGHPAADLELDKGDGARFRAAHGLTAEQPLLCVLPGSRRSEVTKLLPIYGEVVARLGGRFRDLAVVVPTVDTEQEARDVVKWAYFPPMGSRSQGGGPAFDPAMWGGVPGGYRQTINDNLVVIVMIETLEGLKNAEAIAAVPGITAVFAASGDLGNFTG